MRCRDVSRAIAAPNGAITEAEIKAHLASCPRCAGQAEADRRLDRLWEATRPEPPAPECWDAAWARIDQALAAPEVGVEVEPATATAGRPMMPVRLAAGLVLTVASAAAALLLAMNVPEPGPTAEPQADAIRRDFEVPAGHTVLYHVDSGEQEVIQVNEPSSDADLTFFDRSETGLDAVDYFALFNWFEAMPELMASARDDEEPDPGNPFGPLAQ